ncbi:hypothetical protein D3C81_1535880 [compost metagenome]
MFAQVVGRDRVWQALEVRRGGDQYHFTRRQRACHQAGVRQVIGDPQAQVDALIEHIDEAVGTAQFNLQPGEAFDEAG